jgi:PilZ domain-containing protein
MEKVFQDDLRLMTWPMKERRGVPRIRLQVPMFVRGQGAHGEEFLDLAKTIDISAHGAFLAVERAVGANEIVSLTIPAPRLVASGLEPASTPPIQARVRRSRPDGNVSLLGVEFLKPLD